MQSKSPAFRLRTPAYGRSSVFSHRISASVLKAGRIRWPTARNPKPEGQAGGRKPKPRREAEGRRQVAGEGDWRPKVKARG
eukprot:gene9020-biopygen14961